MVFPGLCAINSFFVWWQDCSNSSIYVECRAPLLRQWFARADRRVFLSRVFTINNVSPVVFSMQRSPKHLRWIKIKINWRAWLFIPALWKLCPHYKPWAWRQSTIFCLRVFSDTILEQGSWNSRASICIIHSRLLDWSRGQEFRFIPPGVINKQITCTCDMSPSQNRRESVQRFVCGGMYVCACVYLNIWYGIYVIFGILDLPTSNWYFICNMYSCKMRC